jgi:cytoskeletal protein RodZ
MTVSEVSQSTRVTEPIVRGIEQDDYAACGGDFYARGHIRAIAHAVGTDPAPLIDEFDWASRSEQEITAAEAFQPSVPPRKRERRRVRWTAVLAALVLVVLGFAGYKFVSGFGQDRHASAAASSHPTQPGHASPAHASPTTTRSASPVVARPLAPASVAAFGPAGTADGDNPQSASLAIAGHPATPWYSQWYATPGFGNLKNGTGLLLDMGHQVTVSSVQVSLVSSSGADIQLRAGSSPDQADLSQVASASNAGGTVQFHLSTPAHARYLLVWFTKLPADNAGTYQARVYKIAAQGQP